MAMVERFISISHWKGDIHGGVFAWDTHTQNTNIAILATSNIVSHSKTTLEMFLVRTL